MLRVRKSIAKWMPSRSRPGQRPVGSNDLVAPVASSTASKSSTSCCGSMNFICAAALLHDLRHVAAGEIFLPCRRGRR